jgi:hypothetical protein
MQQLRKVIVKNLPKGFEEGINYGMISYFVPHSIYPKGYKCDPSLPLPFVSIASQKNFIALYHMGIYANPALLDWFVKEYALTVQGKIDMGKSCIRFKKIEKIPFDLIGQLMSKMTADEWIKCYENNFLKS